MDELLRMMPTARGPSAPPFESADLPTSEGWQVDAVESSDSTYAMNVHKKVSTVTEMRNVRKQAWGYECRSGFKPYDSGKSVVPVAKTAYRLGEVLVDVTIYQDGTSIGAEFLNTQTGAFVDKPNLVTVTGTPNVCATQFQTFVVFSIYGYGTWKMSPADVACSTWNAPVSMGKDVCPTPALNGQFTSFAPKCSGDLFVYDTGNVNTEHPDILNLNIFQDPGAKRPRTIRLPVNADYYRSVPFGYAPWERDPLGDNDIGKGTVPTRGYGYKFVEVHKYTDVEGQEFTWRSAPSTDFWVQSAYYSPAQVVPAWIQTWPTGTADNLQNYNGSHGVDTEHLNGVWLDLNLTDKIDGSYVSADHIWLDRAFVDIANNGTKDARSIQPNKQALIDLIGKVRSLLSDIRSRPYSWLMYYFGARDFDDWYNKQRGINGIGQNLWYSGMQPYVPFLTAHELTGASQAQFAWSDFTVASDVVEIEIYRTAYGCPLESDNAKESPLFEAHKYGYVGSVKPDQTFVDSVPDDALDFENESPDRHNGYLAGEFSGSAIRVHGDSFSTLVLGDIVTHFHVMAPVCTSALGIIRDTPDGSEYSVSDLTGMAGDGLHNTEFYLQYVDSGGRVSDAKIAPLTYYPLGDSKAWVYLSLPRGYAPSITGINVIRGVWNGSSRDYKLLKTLNPVTDSVYISKHSDTGSTVTQLTYSDYPKGTESKTPGAITWSDAYDAMAWPKQNFEIHHQFAPVTGMSSVLGPMYVYTDQSITKTDLAGRFELDSDKLGSISRWGLTKYEKVDLFLSKDGLCLTEGSSQRFVRGGIQSEVLKYLREEIPGQPSLANAKRATVSLMGRGRGEVWLRFPSSADLGGTLPARIFIYREFEFTGLQQTFNYEFELDEKNFQGIALFAEHSDGRLFSAHKGDAGTLIVQDNDTGDWNGDAALEIKCPLRELTMTKLFHSIWWWGEIHAEMKLATGMQDAKGVRDRIKGILAKGARMFSVVAQASGFEQAYKHSCAGPSVERRARVPYLRFYSIPDKDGNHRWTIRGIRITYALLGSPTT